MPVKKTKKGAIVILEMFNGQLNVLSVANGFVGKIADSFASAVKEEECDVLVITCKGASFSGGADLSDFSKDPLLTGQLRQLLMSIENCKKPVIVAINGFALGGGLELALAAQHRVAHTDARLGLPEVTLGPLPGAGGTQRLPRLIGARTALAMMLSGNTVTAARAKELGLVDRVIDGDVLEAAIALAEELGGKVRQTGAMLPPSDLAEAINEARARIMRGENRAPQFIVECGAAVWNNLSDGLALEAEKFTALAVSGPSLGLRHVFLGERKVNHILDADKAVQPLAIVKVGVVGGGLMGTGIALAFLNAGYTVTLVEPSVAALERAAGTIRKTIQRDVDTGRIDQETGDRYASQLRLADRLENLADVDLVVEAVFEDMSVKQQVFTALDDIVGPDTFLANNTSALDLNALARILRDPSRMVGLHFFSPANIMRLLEIVRGEQTRVDVLVTAMLISKKLGKVGVVSGVCEGFIGNRVFEEYLRQVWFMLEEGALPQQIDSALEFWGMTMGPCKTMDLVGQDIGWAIRKRRAAEQPERPYSGGIDRICKMGRFGQKTGKGIYVYPDGRTPKVDPETIKLIKAYSAEEGTERRPFDDSEIVERCLLALINEGAQIVGEGIADRPVDVDMTFVHGYGFGKERGGPMFQADELGPEAVRSRILEYANGRNGWAWAAAPLIDQLATCGGSFSGLNQN